MRLRRVERRADVQRGPERSTDLLLDAAFAHAKIRRRNRLQRHTEAKTLLRRTVPVARRALGENNATTLRMRWAYARALYRTKGATLDDLREAMETYEDAERIARRVLGGAHPTTGGLAQDLRNARAALRARKMPSGSSEELLQAADDPTA